MNPNHSQTVAWSIPKMVCNVDAVSSVTLTSFDLSYLKCLSERFNNCLSLSHVVLLSSDFPEQILYLLSFFGSPGSINFDGLTAGFFDRPSFLELSQEVEHC
jgi:hypothetical protein